jgi:two-component system cell cycle sensor histidine kinase/response regulator CckA
MNATASPRLDVGLLMQAQELLHVGTWMWDVASNTVHWSDELFRLWGLEPQSIPLSYETYLSSVHPKDRDRVAALISRALAEKISFEFDFSLVHPSGGQYVYRSLVSVVCDETGQVVRMIGTAQDVTDRVRSDERLRASEEHFRSFFEQSAVGLAITDSQTRFVRVNSSFARFLGYEHSEVVGRTVLDVTHSDDVEMIGQLVRKHRENERSFTYEQRYAKRDGSVVWGRTTVTRLRRQDGTPDGFLGVVEDITESKRSEESLRRQSELLQSILDHLPVMVSVYDAENRPVFLNRKWEHVFGWTLDEVKTINVFEHLYPDKDQRERASTWVREATGEWSDFEATARDGRKVACSWSCVSLSNGSSVRIGQDLSERHQLQQRLVQAQKMEALGQLAGGVAHDFNNLLTVISACATFVMEDVGATSKAADDVREIIAASNRAAALTRQLLAFSRRQMLRPEIVNANEAVQAMTKTLGRLIGEHIHLAIVPTAAVPTVEVDVHQLEQVVLNLVVNARDAIQDSGTITVKTFDCPRAPTDPHGRDYLVISVTDDGAGMEPAVLNRIFEPFFTTKPVGKGTGLGLATVHGIVEQSQGRIEVDSVVGKGTQFRIFLPLTEACGLITDAPVDIDGLRGAETILLVEDEAALRAIARRTLTDLGYSVLEARHGADAARLSAKHKGPIDLLITDVVMPEMGGRELAKHMRRQRPGIPVLYVSGYTDDELLRKGILEADAQLLRKPFMPADLARAVRKLIRAHSLAA